VLPQRRQGDADSPSTISLKQASTIAEIRTQAHRLLPRASQASERFLHLSIGQQGRFAHLGNAMSMHVRFTPSRKRALELISEVWRQVREWTGCFEEFEVGTNTLDAVAPAFRHIDEVSTPALRREIP
jgi:serine/threonine-protein kinase HipA